MQWIKRMLIGVGGVAVAALVISMAAPKSVHALVAALVEVTNTTSNPVPTANVYASATQNVELVCSDIVAPCLYQSPNGGFPTSWSVPAGMNYVITDVGITPFTFGSGTAIFGITWSPTSAIAREEGWAFPVNATAEIQFHSGIVVLPGSTIYGQPGFNVQSAVLRGYLTPN